MIIIYGIYHHFATNNIEITNALVKNKTTRVRRVRRNKRWVDETDYYIETDKGLIMDEGDLFEWDAEGDEYDKVEIGHYYDFKVNYDKLLKTNNALEVKPSVNALEPGNY